MCPGERVRGTSKWGTEGKAKSESARFELRVLPDQRQRLGGLEGKRSPHLYSLLEEPGREAGGAWPPVSSALPHLWLRTAVTQELRKVSRPRLPHAIKSEFPRKTLDTPDVRGCDVEQPPPAAQTSTGSARNHSAP